MKMKESSERIPLDEGLSHSALGRLFGFSHESPRRWAKGICPIPEQIDAEWYYSTITRRWHKKKEI